METTEGQGTDTIVYSSADSTTKTYKNNDYAIREIASPTRSYPCGVCCNVFTWLLIVTLVGSIGWLLISSHMRLIAYFVTLLILLTLVCCFANCIGYCCDDKFLEDLSKMRNKKNYEQGLVDYVSDLKKCDEATVTLHVNCYHEKSRVVQIPYEEEFKDGATRTKYRYETVTEQVSTHSVS